MKYPLVVPPIRRPGPLKVVEQLVSTDDKVESGEPVLVVTDGYTTFLLYAPAPGRLQWACVPGDRCPTGMCLAVIEWNVSLPPPPRWVLEDVHVPRNGILSEDNTGLYIEWPTSIGATVQEGELLYLLDGEKACVEIMADRTGVLVQILKEGQGDFPLGTVVARMLVQNKDTE